MFDLFICHATENKKFVMDLARLLRLNNIECWVDEKQIKIGDRLTKKIDDGLQHCKAGIVVLSPEFISKGPGLREHELDYLIKIEEEKKGKIFPIWLNVTEPDVRNYSPDLADTKAVIFDKDLDKVVREIFESFEFYLGKKALLIPSWEDPIYRFLSGEGELIDRKWGATGNIFETVVNLGDEDFPLVLGNNQYSRKYLWNEIASMFSDYIETGKLPKYYKDGCEEDTKKKIWQELEDKYHMKRPQGA